jgi:histidinol-phosphate aminotransferase
VSGAVVHGGVRPSELRALGVRPEEVIDFSASVSPLGASPTVREALARLDPSAYPDPDCTDLREALATRDGVSSEQILVGNGSVELIHLLAQAYLRLGDEAAVLVPAFGEYAAACRQRTERVREVQADERERFRWRLPEAMAAAAHTRLVFLGNPNNPSGVYLDRREVEAVVHAGPALLAVDEAYRSFVEAPWESRDLIETGRVVLLRSLTKDYGLAGLRLGYCIGPPDLIGRLRARQVSWSVNAAAQAAGLAALADHEHLGRVRTVVREAKTYLCAALADLGLPVMEGAANFVLVKTGGAAEVRLQLLQRGMLVRDCASFGLPAYIRIGMRTRPECARLVVALAEVLEARRAEG